VATTTELDLNGTAGTDGATYRFEGQVTTPMLTTNGGAYALELVGGTSVTGMGLTTFDNTGALTLGDGGDVNAFANGVVASTVASIDLNGTVSAASGVITLDSAGGVDVAGTSLVGGASNSQITLSDLALADDASVTLGAGAATPIDTGSILGVAGGADERVAVDTTGAVSIGGAVGAADDSNDLDDFVVTQSGGVEFAGSVNVDTFTITDTTADSAISFQGVTDIDGGLIVQAGTAAYDMLLEGDSTTIAGTTIFRNTGDLGLGDEATDSLVFATGVTATDPGVIDLNGTVSVNSGDIVLGDADTTLNVSNTATLTSPDGAISVGIANLADDVTLTLGNGGDNVLSVAGAIGTDDGGATSEALVLNSTGTATVTGTIGTDANPLDELTITQSGGTAFDADVDAVTVTLTDTTGAVTFGGDLTANTLATAGQDYTVNLLGGATIASDTTFLNTGAVSLADTTFTGGLDTTAASGTTASGTIRTVDTALDLGATALAGDTTLVSGVGATNVASLNGAAEALTFQEAGATGAVGVAGAIDVASLTTSAGAFDVALTGASVQVGGATTLANTGANVLGDDAADAFELDGGLTATAGATTLFGDFTTDAADLTLAGTTIGGATTINTAGGALTLGATDGGASALSIDTLDGTVDIASFDDGGAVTLVSADAVNVAGGFASSALELQSGTSLTVGGDLAVAGALVNQDVGELTVAGTTSAGSLTSNATDGVLQFTGATTVAGALSLNDGASATFDGTLSAGSLSTGAVSMALNLNQAVTVSGATSLQNTGTTVLGDSGDAQDLGTTLSVAGPVQLFADLTADGNATFAGPVVQSGDSAISSGGGAITTAAIDAAGSDLVVNAGGGTVDLASVSGAALLNVASADTVTTGNLVAQTFDVDSVGALTTNGTFAFDTFDASGTNGSITLVGGGAVTGSGGTTFANGGGVSLVGADVDAFDATFANGGATAIDDGVFAFGGAVDTSGTGLTLSGATLATDSGAVTVGGLTLAGDGAIDATLGGDPTVDGAAVTLGGAVTGDFALEVFAGTGDVSAEAGLTTESLFIRSGSALTLGEVTTSGNTLRAVVSGDIALNGDLLEEVGDISIFTTTGNLSQAAGTTIRAEQGDVHLGALNLMTVNSVETPSGDILLTLLTPDGDQTAGRLVSRTKDAGDTSIDLNASGTVAVVSPGLADFGTADNGFFINASSQFFSLGGGRTFIESSNAVSLTTLPSLQQQNFEAALNQQAAERLPELALQNAVFAVQALGNPGVAVRAQTDNNAAADSANSQLSEEQELLTNLSEDVFQEITLVNAEQQPLCLPESLQGFDAVGCAGDEDRVAQWLDGLREELLLEVRDQPLLLPPVPRPRPASGLGAFGSAGGGGGG
jgi:hypothetical protein